jgi:ribose transport system ATP-binding protein
MSGLIGAMLGRHPAEHDAPAARSGSPRVAAKATEIGERPASSLAVRNLRVGEKLADVSFDALAGEVLGVVGLAGSGRTTLMRALFGDIRPNGGEIRLRGERYQPRSPRDAMSRGVFLIPEDRATHGLMFAKSIYENILLVMLRRVAGLWGFVKQSEGRQHARRMMRALNVRATDADQTVGELSGGNQQKVVLAKALTVEADVLLLDEPTFGVDIGATKEIIANVRAMADRGATVLWVSSDLLEVTQVADRIVVLRDGIVGAVLGREDGDAFTEDALVALMQRRQFQSGSNEVGHGPH